MDQTTAQYPIEFYKCEGRGIFGWLGGGWGFELGLLNCTQIWSTDCIELWPALTWITLWNYFGILNEYGLTIKCNILSKWVNWTCNSTPGLNLVWIHLSQAVKIWNLWDITNLRVLLFFDSINHRPENSAPYRLNQARYLGQFYVILYYLQVI